MTMPAYGPVSPYVTPQMLISAPLGISWNTIPPGSGVTPVQKLAEQSNICGRATSEVDGYLNQVVRATTDTEIYHGPGDYRVNVQQYSQTTRIVLQRWPVIAINSVKVSANAVFPRQWVTLPTGFYEPEYPPSGIFGAAQPTGSGDGGQAIILAPGYVNWCLGRQGYVIQVQYVNGWPHAGLTASCVAGATTLAVDDCTGWIVPQAETGTIGATAVIYDGGQQEVVRVTGTSVTSGPGTLTLAAGTQFAHDSNVGILISTMPRSIQWGTMLLAAAEALARGATSTTVQEVSGKAQNSSSRADTLRQDAHAVLNTFRRVVLGSMPIVSTQNAILGILQGLPMPNGNYLLEAFITPPDPETDYSNPHAYIWPTKGSESRNPADGGTIPRNTGVNTPSGTKPIRHHLEVFLRWYANNDDPNADSWFPAMTDSVMWALRTAIDPLVVTDPFTLIETQLIGIGEEMDYFITIRATEDESYNLYDCLITLPLWELIHA